MYRTLLRPILFLFDPEAIHKLSFFLIRITSRLGLASVYRKCYTVEDPRLEREVFGIKFKNPVGLAAGFDKDASLYRELSNFGFGFIEVGTLTPKPQRGNPKKRLFRLPADRGIINRMGFNNKGVFDAVDRLKKNRQVLIGGNIGKNKTTSNEEAIKDYLICFDALYPYVSYFAVNVSSPNTPGLRELQDREPLTHLLLELKKQNTKLAAAQDTRPKPILLKISPDLSDTQLTDIIQIVKTTGIDGVIATNTTIAREGLKSDYLLTEEQGGLSGQPVRDRSTEVVRFLAEKSEYAFPIIAVGGIMSAADALEKLEAGADLVQLYTGFVYEGPMLVKRINEAILNSITA